MAPEPIRPGRSDDGEELPTSFGEEAADPSRTSYAEPLLSFHPRRMRSPRGGRRHRASNEADRGHNAQPATHR